MRTFLLGTILFFSNIGFGQITLDSTTVEHSIEAHSLVLKNSTDSLSFSAATKGEWIPTKKNGLMFGISHHAQWIKFDVVNPSSQDLDRYVYLPVHHIEYIDAYFVRDKKTEQYTKTGTARSVSSKDILSSAYPIRFIAPANSTTTVYLRVQHNHLPLRASGYIMTKNRVEKISRNTQGLTWFWKGTIIFSTITSLLMFFFTKSIVFIRYFWLTIGVAIFIGIETGDFLLFFDIDKYNNILDIKHIGNVLSIAVFPLFINSLTPIQQLNKKLWKLMRFGIYIFILLILVVAIPGMKETHFLSVVTSYALFITPAFFVALFYYLIKASKNKLENARVLLFVYSFYMALFFVTTILPNLGLIDESPYVYTILFLASSAEILSFLILIGREALTVYKERANLLEKQKKHQKQLILAIVESQEKERNHVGRELHDMVGANMSVIKQMLPEESTPEIKKVINSTIETVRNLSHGLTTPRMSADEFTDEIRELCKSFSNKNITFHCFFHNWKNLSSKDAATHLYRVVQELFQNAVKHSGATQVHLQFSAEDNDMLSIMYDDNGKGFTYVNTTRSGLGLVNIEHRIQLLNGKMTFDTSEQGSGTTVIIECAI